MNQPASSRASRILKVCLPALLLSGCATSYKMDVDTFGASEDPQVQADRHATMAEVTSYKITSKNADVTEDSLRYQEALEYVRTALNGRGLYEAPTVETADMIVELDYGMDSPRTEMQEVSIPVYAQAGGGIVYSPVQIASSTGAMISRTLPIFQPPGTTFIGYETVTMPVTTYEKYLRITARENSAGDGSGDADLWTVSVSSSDQSNDLRKYLPLLASASVGYIGAESNVQRTLKLKENDPTIGVIRDGL